jgi:hypothetical protein
MRERKFFYIFYVIQAAALLYVLAPFLRWNNLLEWDFPGHYAAIWFLREHLLPWATGWNPYFYCGFPQGTFYPPLAHYVTALISFGTGIGPAMKLMLAAALLALPVSFYYFARKWGLNDLQAAVCATWMTAVLFVRGELLGTWNLGSDLRSFLSVGLYANSISLPVLFGFLGALGPEALERRWKLPAFLLGILFLSHAISSLVAGFLVFSIILILVWEKLSGGAPHWRPLVLTVGTGFLLGGAWLLPFMAFHGSSAQSFSTPQWAPAVVLVVLNGAILAIVALRNGILRPLGAMYVLLANFIMAGTLAKLGLEFSRLTIYVLLLIPVLLLYWVRSRIVLFTLAGVAALVGVMGLRAGGLNPAGVPQFPMPNFGPVPGRILAVAPPSHLPSFHVHHELIPLRTGNASMLGLFIQSSPNGRFLGNLTRTLDPDAYVWGTSGEIPRVEALGANFPEYIRDRLRLFDIRWVYTDLKLENFLDPGLASTKRFVNSYPFPQEPVSETAASMQARYNTHDRFFDFYLYPVTQSTLAEPLPYLPKLVNSDWELTTQKWFLEMRGLPVFTDREIPSGVRAATPQDGVQVVAASPRMDKLTLRIDAAEDIPILVKMGYIPGWKLTVNGAPGRVYRASPNLLLVFAHGEAVLELKRPWEEYVGLALSVLGLVVLAVL